MPVYRAMASENEPMRSLKKLNELRLNLSSSVIKASAKSANRTMFWCVRPAESCQSQSVAH